MNRLKQMWVWLLRIGHCRGFGIQAPDDYHFVRYVVNEHWPYHAYDNLPHTNDWVDKKLGRLYLRLANYLQPQIIADLVGMDSCWQAGCRKAVVTHSLNELEKAQSGCSKLIVAPASIDAAALSGCCDENTVLVLHRLWEKTETWNQMMQTDGIVTTFDLYYCGIASFRSRHDSHHYVVNF